MVALEVESWIWWAVIIFVAASRFLSRRLTLGAFRRFQTDDYGMLIVFCFYTTVIVTINIVTRTGSNLFPPGFDVSSLSTSERAQKIYGSKIVLVAEQSQCVTVWGAKICLLILYLRLTTLRWENVAIKALLAYVVGSFVIMEILYFGVWCQPFHEYWAVPTDNIQCDTAINHLITNATFNLSSDLVLLGIGLPMFLRMRLPWQKKVPLVFVFSLGVFVILAAVLNKVYSFTEPFGNMWSYWYVRESSTAMLVANLPFVWVFWRRVIAFDSIIGASQLSTHHGQSGEHHANEEVQQKNNSLDLAEFLRSDCLPPQPDTNSDRPHELEQSSSAIATASAEGSDVSTGGDLPQPPLPVFVPPHEPHDGEASPRRNSSIKFTPSAPPSTKKSWSAHSFV